MELESSQTMSNCIKNTIYSPSAQFCSKDLKVVKNRTKSPCNNLEPGLKKQVKRTIVFEEQNFLPSYKEELLLSRKNSLKSECYFCCSIQCDCSEIETEDNSSDNQSNQVVYSDDACSHTDDISDMLFDQSSICTEQRSVKLGKGIKYLQINPLYPPEDILTQELLEDASFESMVSIFEQIGEYTVRGASLSSGCCFDCRRPHRSMCKKLRLARLSLVGLYCQLPCESNNRRGGRKGEKQEAKEIIQSTRTQRNYGAEVGNRVEQSITVQNQASYQENGNASAPPMQEIFKDLDKPPEVTQKQLLSFSFHLLEHRVCEASNERAKCFLKKFNPTDPYYPAMISMVQEVYRILLLPEEPLKLYISTLSAAKRSCQFSSSLNKLRMNSNKHPLAPKALQKLKTFYCIP